MRVLLAQNALYYPSHGGGDISNRLLMQELAARGHDCRAVARISVFGVEGHELYLAELGRRGIAPETVDGGVVVFRHERVDVHVVTNASLRPTLVDQIASFRPDVIIASTDDPAQLLLEVALRSYVPVVYLVRATLAVPFGPDCAFPSAARTERIRAAARVVGVSRYVADYVRREAGIPAVHVPVSLIEPEEWPDLGRLCNDFVTMANPCAVKGISIFLGLADAFPDVRFAAVPTWGTNQQDVAELRARPNVQILRPVDDMNLLFARTRVLLVPSLWAEARSRIVVEAMLRGVPVMAANSGGIPEAKLGVPYLLPVAPIQGYRPEMDAQMVPVADVPPQQIEPWREALGRLLSDPDHYAEISRASRTAALEYVAGLSVEPFEALLEDAARVPRPAAAASEPVKRPSASLDALSPDKRKLLALRLRRKAPPAAWFPGADESSAPRLFCFPHAGGGSGSLKRISLDGYSVCPVRLPGRESRIAEAPFERMAPLVEALTGAIEAYSGQPFAFFGHSMGAVVAFELARLLRRRGLPLPLALIASAARAPQHRRGHVPPPEPSEEELIAQLRALGGIPAEALSDPAFASAVLPALNADAALYRNYVYEDEDPFAFPIRAYGGASDPNITAAHLEAWREQTTANFVRRLFPGGHFYLDTARNEFLDAIACDLP